MDYSESYLAIELSESIASIDKLIIIDEGLSSGFMQTLYISPYSTILDSWDTSSGFLIDYLLQDPYTTECTFEQHRNEEKMQVVSNCESLLDGTTVRTLVIGSKQDDYSQAIDFEIFGAVLFASLADSKTSASFDNFEADSSIFGDKIYE